LKSSNRFIAVGSGSFDSADDILGLSTITKRMSAEDGSQIILIVVMERNISVLMAQCPSSVMGEIDYRDSGCWLGRIKDGANEFRKQFIDGGFSVTSR
jgi:hypothetical protein